MNDLDTLNAIRRPYDVGRAATQWDRIAHEIANGEDELAQRISEAMAYAYALAFEKLQSK